MSTSDMDFRCQSPLDWPLEARRTLVRTHAQFGKQVKRGEGYKTKDDLHAREAAERVYRELRSMNRYGHPWRTTNIVLSSNVQIGKSGWPLASAKEPEDPGVCCYFILDGKAYALPCDKWKRAADNMAAIAAHIGAMRGVERWGVGEFDKLFAGFEALPAKKAKRQWHEVLGFDGDDHSLRVTTLDDVLQARRRLMLKAHPDQGGSREAMEEIEEAVAEFKRLKGIE